MAVVYGASHPDFDDVVALKRPLPWPQAADRLRREVAALTALQHAHVMPVVAHGVDKVNFRVQAGGGTRAE